MTVRWAYRGRPVSSVETLVRSFGASALASPKRSTVPLLAYWRDANRRLPELAGKIGATFPGDVLLDFEHEVPVQMGTGPASCTDLMITGGDATVAIEAKFTEGRYEDVRTWLGSPASTNREDVLKGWLALVSQAGRDALAMEDVMGLPYQLIHRAASACHAGARQPWLVYQMFDTAPDKLQVYREDLRSLARLLGERRQLKIRLLDCGTASTARYKALVAAWESGVRDLHEGVIQGLLEGTLMETEVREVVSIE